MTPQFGSYLVHSGRISAQTLVDALELQRRQRPLIGRVALDEKKLGVRELMRILHRQAESPAPFGQIAVALGLLTEADVAHLLELQRQKTPRLGAVLTEMGVLGAQEAEELATAFIEFQQEMAAEAALRTH